MLNKIDFGNNDVNSPIKELVFYIINELKAFYNNELDGYTKTDNDLQLLLMNNDCGFLDESKYKYIILNGGKYEIDFITGAKGNPKNIFYDYFDAYYIKHLVIFLDYFKNINPEEDQIIIGNSNYVHAIKIIVEIFLYSYYGVGVFNGPFTATVSGTNMRYLPAIIAGMIMNSFRPIEAIEFEGNGISYEYFKEIINNVDLEKILLGIRNLE